MKKGRRLLLDWNQRLPKYWFDNSPLKSHLFNGIQIYFPNGEQYFIDSVRIFKKSITDRTLVDDVDEFIRQEAWHAKVHNDYNKWLEYHHYPVKSMLDSTNPAFDLKVNSDLGNLAGTVVQEHLTAVLADWFYNNPGLFESMHPHFREIWSWHMAEESAHRAVSYDVWKSVTDKIIQKHPKFKKIFDKVLYKPLLKHTFIFCKYILHSTFVMLRRDHQLYKWRTIRDFVSLMFNLRNGLIIHTFKPFFCFFKEDFHPWTYAKQPAPHDYE